MVLSNHAAMDTHAGQLDDVELTSHARKSDLQITVSDAYPSRQDA